MGKAYYPRKSVCRRCGEPMMKDSKYNFICNKCRKPSGGKLRFK